MTLAVYCLKNMYIADARVIFCTAPVYTVLLGRIFLKESVTKFDLIATKMLCLGGVVLVAKPTFLFGSALSESSSTKQEWLPAILAVFCSFCFACSTVLRGTQRMISVNYLFGRPSIPYDFLKGIFTSNVRDMENLRPSVFGLIKMSFLVPEKGQLRFSERK